MIQNFNSMVQRCRRRGAGVQAHPQKFWFVENPDRNGTQRCLISKTDARGLQKNTWRSFFFFLQKICKQKSHKNCSGNFGEIQAKSFAPPKIRLLLRHGRNDQKLDLFCFRVYHFRYRNSILFNRKSAFCFRFCSQWKNSKRQLAVCTSKWYKNSKWRVLLYMAKRYG